MTELDPTTVEIVRNHVNDAAKEMQATVMNAAYSPLWHEAGDLSCAILNPNAEIVGQSERVIPIHVATMLTSTTAAIEGTGSKDALVPGDVLIQNDPYAGNNHLPDILLAQPVFVDGILVGFSAVRGHWEDIGGVSAGSYSTDTGEIIREGLRVPPAKLYEAGDRNDALYNVLLANVREPAKRRGDFQAQLGGVHSGHERLGAIAERYGAETVRDAMERVLSNDEQAMKSRLRDLPDGCHKAVDFIDGAGLENATHVEPMPDTPLPIQVAVRIDGDSAFVDFAGTHEQVDGGVNAALACTKTATQYAFKCALDPGDPGTLGAFRPIAVTAPSGSLVNPRYPAPVVTGNHETANRIYDVVLKVLGEFDPGATFAAGDGSSNVFVARSMSTKQIYNTPLGGGMGACPTRDGVHAIRSGLGNTGVQPIERVEEDYDFLTIEEFSIAPDTGGAGRYRGGNAARRVTRLDHECEIAIVGDRSKTRPFGVDGGDPGSAARHQIESPNGDIEELPSKTTRTVPAGSRIFYQPAGGGGYGNPSERPWTTVREDLEDGYVTLEEAKEKFDTVSPSYE